MREKVEKLRKTGFSNVFCGSGGSKSKLAKAAGAEPSVEMRDEKLHAVVARRTCRSQNVKKRPHVWSTFGSCDVQKRTPLRHEARFEVKMAKTSCSEHVWKLRCWKSALCCGAKHMSKYVEVKMQKTHHSRANFGS